jgi:PKD repeat protein
MHRNRGFLLGVACVAAALVLAPAAGAVVVKLRTGHYAGIHLRHGVNPAAVPGAVAARTQRRLLGPESCPTNPDNGTVCYLGGPVLHTSDPYLVFWDPGGQIPASSEALIRRYLSDVAADTGENDDVYGGERQYYDSTGFAAQRQTFSSATQVITDQHAFPGFTIGCPQVSGYTGCVTDQDIENELTDLIQNHGYPSGTGPGAPIYFVITPPATDVCDGTGSCADPSNSSSFCGYHTYFQVGGANVVYAVVPFGSLGPAQNVLTCQYSQFTAPQEPNTDPADVIVDDLSHENSESITDPIVNTGWLDNNASLTLGSGDEIADNCQSYGSPAAPPQGISANAYPILGGNSTPANGLTYGTAYDQLINGDQYITQTEWSNGDLNCEPSPAAGTVAPSFTDTGPAAPGKSVSFNPAASTAAHGISSATWSFGDGTSTDFTIGAPTPVAHAFASAGDHTVTLTLVDDSGNLATVSHVVAVGNAPNAAFSWSPTHPAAGSPVQLNASGSSDPNTGATIRTYAWNFGDGATTTGPKPAHTYAKPGVYSVSLKVTDSLGLSATKIASLTVLAPGKITRLAPARSGSSEYLAVTVSEPGRIQVGTKSVTLQKAGSASFRVGAAPAPGHRLTVNVTVVYTPEAGPVVRRNYSAVIVG